MKLCELADAELQRRKAENAHASKLRRQRGIVNLTTGQVYDCIFDAAKIHGCTNGTLGQAARNHWKIFDCFWQFKDIVDQTSIEQQLVICEQSQRHNTERQRSIISNLGKSKRRPVVNLHTGEEYESAVAASRAIGVDEASVGVAIRKQVRCKGFYWEYKSVVEQKGRENLLQQYQQAKIDNIEQGREGRRKKVVCVDDGIVYESLRALAKAVGCHPSTVDNGLRYNRRIKGKYYKYLNQ